MRRRAAAVYARSSAVGSRLSIFDLVTRPARPEERPEPAKLFAQLFTGGQLPDIGPIDDVLEGARTFLSNVPKDNALAAVLDVVQRPNFAIANATRKALKGGNVQDVLGAAGAGFVGKEKTTFSTVLEEQGKWDDAAASRERLLPLQQRLLDPEDRAFARALAKHALTLRRDKAFAIRSFFEAHASRRLTP